MLLEAVKEKRRKETHRPYEQNVKCAVSKRWKEHLETYPTTVPDSVTCMFDDDCAH